jgi:hypothetical protein
MAKFLVHNISGTRFHVPPPVGLTLNQGATVEVEAASLDTDQIAALVDDAKITITHLTADTPAGDSLAGASIAQAGGPQVQLGNAGATNGLDIGNGETMTFTHGLGLTPTKVLVMDEATGDLLVPDAGITIGGSATTVTVANATGGALDVIVEIHFEAGSLVNLAAVIPETDSRIAIA